MSTAYEISDYDPWSMSFSHAKANYDSYACHLYNNIFTFLALPKRLRYI